MTWTPDKIKSLRLTLSMTQAQFADKIGVTAQYVQMLEYGTRKPSKPLSMVLDFLNSNRA